MPRRGEVWLVDLGMAQKTRPAVILNVPYGSSSGNSHCRMHKAVVVKGEPRRGSSM